ncbi:MAG: metalloregulator ArsR/SmtB family transcription factor [Chloroflexota bacterium]
MIREHPPSNDEQLLDFFKAMADANRLKMIGLLAQKALSVEELAALLDLRASTVSHHLQMLGSVGLVEARSQSYYNVYELRPGVLEKIAQRLLAQETLPAMAADVDLDAYDRKVLHGFLLPNGRLKVIPAQRKKREAVMRHVVKSFELGRRYTEVEVNEILSRFHSDVATMRRELIVSKLLGRENGEYWVVQ